jgi:hypothetical protein
MESAKRRPNFEIVPTLDLAAGGAGKFVDSLVQELRLDFFLRVLDKDQGKRVETARLLGHVFPSVHVDSDSSVNARFERALADEESHVLTAPDNYRPLTSLAGLTIIERMEDAPFQHFKRWRIDHEILKPKRAGREAEAVRVYGAANLFASIKGVYLQLSQAIDVLQRASQSPAADKLREAGLKVEDTKRRCQVFFSTAGGSGTGAIVAVLGMLALLIEKLRDDYEVILHVMLPGFHAGTSKQTRHAQEVKTVATLANIQQLLEGVELTIPFPDGDLHLTEGHTTQLVDDIFVHEPAACNSFEPFYPFINRVAYEVMSTQMSAFGEALRSNRSNSLAEIRRHQERKLVAV